LLHALDYSIGLLSSDSLSDELVSELAAQFADDLNQLGINNNERERVIRTATRFLFHSEHQSISPANLRPTIESAGKALGQWRLYGSTQVGDLQNLIDEGPSLLIQEQWRRRPEIHSYFWKYYPDAWKLIASGHLPLWYRLALLFSALLGIVGLPGLIYAIWTAFGNVDLARPVFASWGITAIATYFAYWLVLAYCALKLAKGALQNYLEILGFGVAVGLASMYSAIQLLSSK
jgi:hypothetical protein